MKTILRAIIASLLILTVTINGKGQSLYFPPLVGNTWDTISPASLGWCANYLDTLDNLLAQKNTKAIIILKDGKIAHETYFGTFTVDSNWYWASAGKTLTGFCVGLAQEQNYLSINDSTSQYLGAGWTSELPAQESLITVRNQITMTSGLDDGVVNSDCTLPSCLQYLADAGTRWAYHNAPYTLLESVIDSATGNYNAFFNTQLRNKIGMNGFWFNSGYNHVYYSKPRSMARFGLLMLNKGIWNTDTVMHDTAYFNQMINTSQNLNLSYGYLWWLNGKASFMIPQSQIVFPSSLIPNAPADMYCALGKNDQKIHVVPSQHLVIIRMGESADSTNLVPITLDYQMWNILNQVFCNTTAVAENKMNTSRVFPNPFSNELSIQPKTADLKQTVTVCDVFGKTMFKQNGMGTLKINTGAWPAGIYFVQQGTQKFKVVKH